MDEFVRELVDLTGWRGSAYGPVAWDAVEAGLGVELPADYKELLATFAPGTFNAANLNLGKAIVMPPYTAAGKPDHLHQFRTEMRELREWQEEHPEDVPHPIHPEPGGMIPWARAAREVLLWVREPGQSPDEWTVAVSNGGIWRCDEIVPVVEEFDCGAVEFLAGLVRGSIVSTVLTGDPENLTSPPLAARFPFRPVSEDDWWSMSTIPADDG
ncbi:hypothetical protein [Actinokineospora spheciospongiae]|uniref:hypothetical protein n=1 Tax=Actinokineospora spheciospongiae TaxID=909613 RepID=UPI000D70D6F8|nr:hypothetical protein [Actinokineospora spheciospongiae]PWW63228.1 hypothetical protein DFQ13_104218 [Actinokineospora spheciospongiae]